MSTLVDARTLAEVHPYLKNKWRVQYLVRTGQIPVVRVGKKKLAFDLEAVDKWIKERTRSEVSE